MEDASGRVLLGGSICQHTSSLVTGVVIAVKGRISANGIFMVSDELFSFDLQLLPELVQSAPLMALPADKLPQSMLMMVSGLGLGSTEQNAVHDLAVQLLVDFVAGRSGDAQAALLASRITR